MKKKIILFFINRGAVEVDVILPLLYQLKAKYIIITVFKNNKAFQSLKSIKQLYELWKSVSDDYFVDSIYENFIFKIAKKIFLKIKNSQNIIKYLDDKIYDLKKIKKKYLNTGCYIKYIFSDLQVYNHYLKILKKNDKDIKIVIFPNTPIISFSDIYLNEIYQKNFDYLFLTREEDIERFKNLKKNTTQKILITGVMKFEKWWINLLLEKKSIIDDLDNKEIITIAYNSRFDWLSNEDKKNYEEQLEQMIKFFKEQNSYLYVFKLHPNVNSKKFFSLIKQFKFKNYCISKDHLINLSYYSKLLISHKNSAAALDAMTVKCPVVELWSPGGSSFDSLDKMKILKSTNNINEFKKNFVNALNKSDINSFCDFEKFNENYQSSKKKKLNSIEIANLLG